jgi:hypothetical protein
LPPAGFPLKRLQTRLNRNAIWARPTMRATTLIKALRFCADAGKKATSPSSW